MRRARTFWKYLLAPGAVGTMLYCLYAQAGENNGPPDPGTAAEIRLVQAQPPGTAPSQPPGPAPAQPPGPAPAQPPGPAPSQPPGPSPAESTATPPATAPGGAAEAAATAAQSLFGNVGGSTPSTAAGATATQAQAPVGSASVSGAEAQTRAASDAGDLLSRSQAATGVEVQRRNPIINDPRVRGYKVGDLLTQVDGAFVLPARQDLDTIVSKIEANQIRNAVVVKGPYSVRYGPGLAFIDIETHGTERYRNGFEWHGLSTLTFKTNGEQWRGRQAFWGGSDDWGYRIGYDLMAGQDYRAGNGIDMPSSYNAQNIDFAFGYDFSTDNHLEIKIIRQDLHDVELPGQIFDISRGITDLYTARHVLENQEYFDRLSSEVWYSYTRFNGNNFSPGKRQQIPLLNDPAIGFEGITDGDVILPGFREMITWGTQGNAQLTLGVDMRYVRQKLNEYDTSVSNLLAVGRATVNNPIPRSHWSNPGLFLDDVLPVTDNLTLKSGARVDFISADINNVPPPETLLQALPLTLGTTDFQNNYNTWAAYITGEYKVTPEWTTFGNMGIAQRPPTLTELYAGLPFLAVVQNGLNYVTGNPGLSPEQAWQIDIGARAQYERMRAGATLFYAWIHNYVTYQLEQPTTGGAINGLKFVNTPQATLSGFELYGDYDLYDWLTPFATMSFVEGRDETRDRRGSLVLPPPTPAVAQASLSTQEPLPSIPPLDTRLGLRFHEVGRNPRYGVELTSRIVAAQNRIAQSLQEVATPGFTVWDLRSYWQANKNLLLTAGVENMFDKTYREHLDLRTGATPILLPNGTFSPTGPGVLQPGINFYFGAQLTY